ncbi:hypothetical protein ABTP16_15240, partial [Acinetobacter baumannii]
EGKSIDAMKKNNKSSKKAKKVAVEEERSESDGSGGSSPVSDVIFPDFGEEEQPGWEMMAASLTKYPSNEIDWAAL